MRGDSVASKSRKIRRSKTFQKRSLASKKGWDTRKKKLALEKESEKKSKLIRNAKKGIKGKQLKKGEKSKKGITVKIPKKRKPTIRELEEVIKYKDKQLEILELTKNWEHAMPPEYLHKDGTLALEPSSARHWGPVTDKILELLGDAYSKGNSAFDRAVDTIAAHFKLTAREIYTLWYSP